MHRILLALLVSTISYSGIAQIDSTQFVTTWDTRLPGASDSLSIYVPFTTNTSLTYNFDIDWDNDGVFDTLNLSSSSGILHTYSTAGVYTVRVRGTFPAIKFDNQLDRNKITSIDQWGTKIWERMDAAYSGCSNLTYNATDAPNLLGFVDCYQMFQGASSFDGDLSNWDASKIINTGFMFFNASSFNGNISNWDVSNVTNMSGMFWQATSFNQDIGNWDVSSITNMNNMFEFAASFNQNLGQWDVSAVTSMNSMFYLAGSFTGDSLENWDVSSVTDMNNMFGSGLNFNGNLSNWDVSSVTNMSFMFEGADKFDHNLGNWDISSVTNMTSMFGQWNPTLGMSIANYDSTLIGWQQNSHQQNVTLGVNGLEYCAGDSARTLLIADGWNINGDNINCQTVGLKENSITQLSIYPNPSSGVIYFSNAKKNSDVRAFNMSGQLVVTDVLRNELLDLSELEKGLYVIELEEKKFRLILTD